MNPHGQVAIVTLPGVHEMKTKQKFLKIKPRLKKQNTAPTISGIRHMVVLALQAEHIIIILGSMLSIANCRWRQVL